MNEQKSDMERTMAMQLDQEELRGATSSVNSEVKMKNDQCKVGWIKVIKISIYEHDEKVSDTLIHALWAKMNI